jgi:hypothetical protein
LVLVFGCWWDFWTMARQRAMVPGREEELHMYRTLIEIAQSIGNTLDNYWFLVYQNVVRPTNQTTHNVVPSHRICIVDDQRGRMQSKMVADLKWPTHSIK